MTDSESIEKVDMNASEDTTEIPDELTLLKERAKTMGLTHHPSIGAVKLKAKIDEALGVEEAEAKTETASETKKAPAKTPGKPAQTPAQLKAAYHTRLRKEANKLIRLRITCMNTNKKDWPGEIFSVSNSVVGTIKKFIPFTENEAGYHVPYAIYLQMKERKFQQFRQVSLPNGQKQMKGSLVKEFNLEILDPLTQEELKELATKQALNHSIDR